MSTWPPRNQREARRAVETGGARQRRDEAAASVDEIAILHSIRRRRTEADKAIFALHGDGHSLRDETRHESRQADSKIDEHAVAQLQGDAARDDFLGVHQRALPTMCVTSTPGVRTASGGMTPTGHDLVGFGDDAIGGERHDRVEIRGREPIGQIAVIVGLMRAQQGEIRPQRLFDEKARAVDLDHLLALRDDRSHAGRRQDAAKPASRRREFVRRACLAV